MLSDSLASFPYVSVRLACEACNRKGSYRLARLAAKYGAECSLDELLGHLAGDCRYWRPRHPFKEGCKARFIDLDPPTRPPDMPGRALKVLAGGKAKAG
jgi:hypothetical protein